MKINEFFKEKNYVKIIFAILIVGIFFYLLIPFLMAIIMGGVIALALNDTVKKLERKNLSRILILSGMILIGFLVSIVPTVLFFLRGSAVLTVSIKNPEFTEKLTLLQTKALEIFNKFAPRLGLNVEDIQKYLYEGVGQVSSFLINLFSMLITAIPNLVLFMLIVLVAFYFFLMNAEQIRELSKKYFNFFPENNKKFIQILQSSSREVFLANGITGCIQAFLVTIGAVIFGFDEWFLIFFITFISSFIPVIGAGPIAFILSLYSFAVGHSGAGVGMFIISLVSGTADNIIRPYFGTIADVEVPAVIGFIAVLGGVVTMGIPGLFLGPFVASLAFGTLPLIFEDVEARSSSHDSPE